MVATSNSLSLNRRCVCKSLGRVAVSRNFRAHQFADFRLKASTSNKQRRCYCCAKQIHELPKGVVVEQGSVLDNRAEMIVTVPSRLINSYWQAAHDRLKGDLVVNGASKNSKDAEKFLKDKGADYVRKSALELLLTETLGVALENDKRQFVPNSEKVETDASALLSALDRNSSLSFRMSAEVYPEIRWKHHYTTLDLSIPGASNSASDMEQVEKKLMNARKATSVLKIAQGRGVQQGDVVVVNLSVLRRDTNELVSSKLLKRVQVDTDVADDTLLYGFLSGIQGMKVLEERTFRKIQPQGWYEKDLRGVECEVKCELLDLFEWDLQPLTDAWAEEQFPNCGGVEPLKQTLYEAQRRETQSANETLTTTRFLEALGNIVEVEVPRSLVNTLAEQEFSSKLLELQTKAGLGLEDIGKMATEEALAGFTEENWDELRDMAKSVMAAEEICRREGLEPSAKEADAEFERAALEFIERDEAFDEDRLKEQSSSVLQGTKVVEWLKDNCQWQLRVGF